MFNWCLFSTFLVTKTRLQKTKKALIENVFFPCFSRCFSVTKTTPFENVSNTFLSSLNCVSFSCFIGNKKTSPWNEKNTIQRRVLMVLIRYFFHHNFFILKPKNTPFEHVLNTFSNRSEKVSNSFYKGHKKHVFKPF